MLKQRRKEAETAAAVGRKRLQKDRYEVNPALPLSSRPRTAGVRGEQNNRPVTRNVLETLDAKEASFLSSTTSSFPERHQSRVERNTVRQGYLRKSC